MSDIQFEPFGEQVAQTDKYGSASLRTPMQNAVSRIGIGIFWTLVVGIVAARAIYFNPDFAQSFVAHLSIGVRAVLGG